jgi:predicted DNA binding CopG/RHH family protein
MKRTTQPHLKEQALTSLRLDPHIWRQIKIRSAELGIPAVRIVEEALELWLRAQKGEALVGARKR